jgi:tetratricopeptide (TPR) repeat protein
VILTPSALERCAEPGDWLRREIEYALEHQRNIVPLMFEGFHFSDVQKYLTGKLNVLPQYNALEIPSAYFDEAMNRLQTRFLSKPLDVLLHPTPVGDKQIVAETIAKAEQQPTVTEQRLSAEEWFERGLKRAKTDYEGTIADYSEAIRLNPQHVDAYYNRGNACAAKGDFDGAIANYNETIRLNPQHANAYYNRGNARSIKKDWDSAIADYTEAIRLNPQHADAYYNRGKTHYIKKDWDSAIADYETALQMNPKHESAKNNLDIAQDAKAEQE